MIVFGGAIVLMGLAQNALTLDLTYVALGITFAVPETLFGALLQHIMPAQMMGRVMSVIVLLAMAMNPARLFLAGWLGDTLGVRAGLWVGGGAIAALATLILFLPAVRALNQRAAEAGQSAEEAVAPALAERER